MSKTMTKSIRLSPEEARELAKLSQKVAATEATLMKKWIRDGIQSEKLDLAVQAYMQRKTDLRGGAVMAGISYNRFLREVQARNILILEEDNFLDRLSFLADAFDDEELQAAVAKPGLQPKNLSLVQDRELAGQALHEEGLLYEVEEESESNDTTS